MREIRLLRSNGRELETGPGRTLHGHEAGNGGHSQGDAYRYRASSRPYLRLPPAYRDYLRNIGWFVVPGKEFFGLGPGIWPFLDVVRVSEMEWNATVPLPMHLLPLRNTGGGDFYCLDLADPRDEAPVVLWVHDDGPDQKPAEEAISLTEWLQNTLDQLDG